MKILADECTDGEIIRKLRQQNHDVTSVAETSSGVDDEEVLRLANKLEAVLMTEDTDFGELIFRMQQVSHGVVLIRLSGLRKEEKATLVTETLAKHENEMNNSFSVIGKQRIRIRRISNT